MCDCRRSALLFIRCLAVSFQAAFGYQITSRRTACLPFLLKGDCCQGCCLSQIADDDLFGGVSHENWQIWNIQTTSGTVQEG